MSVVTSALSLIGEAICNSRGERLGRLDDIFVEPDHGRIVLAIVASGGFGRAERELRPVPWELLRFDELSSSLLLELSPEELAAAPSFSRDERPNLSETQFLLELHRLFGLESARENQTRSSVPVR